MSEEKVKRIKHPIGIHANRIPHGYKEKAFVYAWQKEQERWDVLDLLLRKHCEPSDQGSIGPNPADGSYYNLPIGDVTDRDRIIVETFMQWLGTNCGFCFLEEALKEAGYKLEKTDQ